MKLFAAALFILSIDAIAADPVVSVYEEPRHRLMQDGENHRVLDLEVAPGDTTLFHVHDQPIFYVYLKSAAVRAQALGGEWIAIPETPLAAGDVRFDESYVDNPVTHRVGNIGEEPFRLILVLNERDTPFAPDIDIFSMMPGRPGVESQYFAQSRIDLAPHEALEWSGPDHLVVYVLITDTHVVIRHDGGEQTATGMHDPGHFVTVSSNRHVSFENRGGEPATIIAVAVR
jgi:hypothetical protein